jgi:hypothetical protein
VDLPYGVEAAVELPDGSIRLVSGGSHQFSAWNQTVQETTAENRTAEIELEQDTTLQHRTAEAGVEQPFLTPMAGPTCR